MDRSYGTLSTIRLFFNGLKSVATIWFIPTEFKRIARTIAII
jgi:hypothetical protein